MTSPNLSLTVRRASAADSTALADLAALDSARPLGGDVLVASVDGAPVAAVSLTDGRSVADPFRSTADALAVLRVRAAQLGRAAARDGTRARGARLALGA